MNKLFASAAVKNTTKVQKLVELHGIRNLFGRLLYISTLERIDIEKVFQNPLTPIPLPLSHMDSSINKIDKARLLHKLEGMIESEKAGYIDVTLVDETFLLNLTPSLHLVV